jgi:hypothetical protein
VVGVVGVVGVLGVVGVVGVVIVFGAEETVAGRCRVWTHSALATVTFRPRLRSVTFTM